MENTPLKITVPTEEPFKAIIQRKHWNQNMFVRFVYYLSVPLFL